MIEFGNKYSSIRSDVSQVEKVQKVLRHELIPSVIDNINGCSEGALTLDAAKERLHSKYESRRQVPTAFLNSKKTDKI